ncbi:MAG TPA: hypothetical protein VK839_01035 [Erythrobacter sp.]|nr:hypothetical protein [Erythrobacter sp.]
MRTSTAIGIATVGGAIAYQFLPEKQRERISSAIRHQVSERMEDVLDSMPEDSPPRLVRDVLPKIESQNEEIVSLLREQNALLNGKGSVRAK